MNVNAYVLLVYRKIGWYFELLLISESHFLQLVNTFYWVLKIVIYITCPDTILSVPGYVDHAYLKETKR